MFAQAFTLQKNVIIKLTRPRKVDPFLEMM